MPLHACHAIKKKDKRLSVSDDSDQNSAVSTSAKKNLELLDDLCETMIDGSLCAMGGLTPFPVKSALKYFPEDFKINNEN